MSKQLSLRIPGINSIPAPVRVLIKPMVVLAIGLHGLILFFPLSGQQPKPKPQKKDEPIKLTQLAKAPPQLPKVQRNLPKAKVDRPKPPVTAPPKPATPAGNPATQSGNVLADFPHYPNAQPNCYGKTGDICRFTSDNFSAVIAHFEKALPTNKFKVEVDSDGSGEKIYRLTKGGQSFYLSVLADPPLTVYFLTSDKIDRAKLAKIKAGPVVQTPPELQALLNTIAPPAGGNATDDPTPVDLAANADSFFQSDPNNPSNQTYLAGIDSGRIAADKSEAAIVSAAKAKFDSVNQAGSYGGGSLYELRKGPFTGYLSVVPGKVGGTVVFIWLQKPI